MDAPVEIAGSVIGMDVYAHAGVIDVLAAYQTGVKGGNELRHRRSRDGGRTWSAETPVDMHGTTVSMAMRGLDPQIVAHGDALFAVWTTPGEGAHGVGPFGTALSSDGGRTWRPGPDPDSVTSRRGHAFIELGADARGAFHIVWLETRETRGLLTARSHDGGRTWQPTQAIDAETCECCWNRLLSPEPGTMFVLYRDKDPRDMALAVTVDDGRSWKRLGFVGEFGWDIKACPFTGGGLVFTGTGAEERLHALVFSGERKHKGISYLRSADRGRTWGEPAALGDGRGHHGDLAVAGNRLAAVWDLPGESGMSVVARFSEDAGETWGPVQAVSHSAGRADFPRVVAAGPDFVAFWTEKEGEGLVRLRSASVAAAAAPAPARQAQGSPPRTTAEVLAASKATDWRPLDLENTLVLEVPSGRVVIEMAPAFAPRHVANVKALAREGFFDGLAVVRAQDNYVAQWGDPDSGEAARRRPTGKAQAALPAEFTMAATPGLPFTVLKDGDGYAPEVGFSNGFPAARDPRAGRAWLAHCYAMLGAGRDNDADSGSGAELYAVIGHAPRHLDRNVTLFGRVVQGIERLSTLPRGTGPLGFYERPEERTPIRRVRVAADLTPAERPALEVIRTDTEIFAALVESRRNRRDDWTKVPAGHVELCNVPLPVRAGAGQ
jgi:peptidylprolyl isomerase